MSRTEVPRLSLNAEKTTAVEGAGATIGYRVDSGLPPKMPRLLTSPFRSWSRGGGQKHAPSGSKSGSGRWSHWDEIGWVHYPEIGWSHSDEIRGVQSLEILHLSPRALVLRVVHVHLDRRIGGDVLLVD